MQLFILIFFSSLICGLHETGDQAVLGGWPNRLMRSYLRVPCEGHVGLLKLLCHDVREANSVFPFSKFRINYTFTVCRASEATAYSGSYSLGLPGGSDGKVSACNVGDLGLILGLGRSPGGGHATHSSILTWRISMDIGASPATVHGVEKSQTQVSDSAHTNTHSHRGTVGE